jgi:hypothetical protein
MHVFPVKGSSSVGNAEMSPKKPMLKIANKLSSCFRLEGDTTLFSVAEFMRVNQLPDDPRLRKVVNEELRDMFPDVRIVEEEN